MKNKKKLLKEDITSAASPSYLPQLNQPFTNIVNGLKDENVEWRPVIVRVGQLKPLQKNVTVDKMKSISSDMLDNGKEMDPIFISNDDYILDGHHRAAGLINAKGKDEKIKCIRIDLDKDNGVRMLNKVSDRLEFEEQHKQKEDKSQQVENKNVLRFNKKQLEEYAKQVIENNLEEYDLNENNDEEYIKKSYFIDPHPDRISKAEEYGLIDIENEDLTPEGLIAKMREWDEGEHGVEAYIYDMTKEQLEKQGYEMPKEIRRLSDDVENINPAFHGGYHTDFPGFSLNEDDEENDFWKFFSATEIDSIEFEGVVYVDGKNKVIIRAYDGKKIKPTKQQIEILKKEAFEGEGGYEGLMENDLDNDVYDIEFGDFVDFGSYGRLYVIRDSGGDRFWVTDRKEDRFNSDAPGWFIRKLFAKNIIEKGNDEEIIDENELEEGPRTHSELRRQKIKSYPEKHQAKSRLRPYERKKYTGSYDISENNEDIDTWSREFDESLSNIDELDSKIESLEEYKKQSDIYVNINDVERKINELKNKRNRLLKRHKEKFEKNISEDKINRYIRLKEKYNIKNLPSEELSLEEQDKFMEELIDIKENIPTNKRKVRLTEKQFVKMITNIKNEHKYNQSQALAGLPIAGELPALEE